MSDLFSTPASHAFSHTELEELSGNAIAGPSRNGDAVARLDIEEAFEVEDTVKRILEGGYKTIGLQFPDELLPSSVPVYRAIQRRIQSTGAQAYVLADSTYGSCCPDVLSCLHLPADFLVHYGHACLTPTDSLPVHYVFPRKSLDVSHALELLLEASKDDLTEEGGRKGVVVVWDVAYDWKSEEIVQHLSSSVSHPISFAVIRQPSLSRKALLSHFSDLQGAVKSDTASADHGKAPSLRSIEAPSGLSMADCVIWYIGEEGRGLVNLQMQNADASIYLYAPANLAAKHLTSTSRLLQRRLLSIHSAVSSSIFGLVVHSVGLSSAQPLLAELRRLLKQKRKKSYTLTVGRLNPAKLANFETVECFVLVGCNEGGLVDSKDFLRPIITPWELILALQGPEHPWEPGRWTLDMSKVLEEARTSQEADAFKESNRDTDDPEDDDDDGPVFSLVDGTYKSRKMFGTRRNPERDPSGAMIEGIKDLTLRNKEFSLARLESAGSHYLSSRSFQGLEVRYGEDEPAVLEEGRSGIARGYTEEKE